VRNGSISGFDYAGVFFPNFQVVLEDLTLNDNYQAGVYRHSAPANLKADTQPAVLRRVIAFRNGFAGVYGYGMTIENSSLSQNFGAGLFTQGYNNLFETVLSHNKLYGFNHAISASPLPDAMRGIVLKGNGIHTVQFLPESMGGNLINTTLY